MKQKYQIEIKSGGDYDDEKKLYKTQPILTPKEFLGLVDNILNFLDKTKKAGTDEKESVS